MTAQLRASFERMVELPAVADEFFLKKIAEALERFRSESEKRGHPLLASLLDIARGEAEDDLKTHEEAPRLSSEQVRVREHGLDDDEGVLRMAEKLACRAANKENVTTAR